MDLKPYLKLIRSEFPEITYKRVTLPQQGMDHLAIFLDEEWVFRFPLNKEYIALFPNEVRLLNVLNQQISLPIPHYECISPDKSFGGYKKIHGKPLTHTGFKRMSAKAKDAVATELAQFFNELHAFPISKAQKLGVPFEDPSVYFNTLKKEYVRYIKTSITPAERKYSEEILSLSEAYATEKRPIVMIHNDVRSLHILIAKNNHIAGIIDFGDKAIGDPAKDFSALWDIDPSFVKAVYEQYKKKDPSLIGRSLLLRKHGSLSWLAYNAKAGTPKSYERAYRLFKKMMKVEVD